MMACQFCQPDVCICMFRSVQSDDKTITTNKAGNQLIPEKRCMDLLAEAWNAFADLTHSDQALLMHSDDMPDFRKAIHNAQRIVATLHARRISPDLFK